LSPATLTTAAGEVGPDLGGAGEMGTDSGAETGSMTVGELQPSDELEEGCTCGTGRSRNAWWLLLALPATRRRRRRRAQENSPPAWTAWWLRG